MITPLDVVCLHLIHAEKFHVPEAHYHLADAAVEHPRYLMDEANFHLINRAITMDQIGFDYYDNVVVYRV